MAADRKKIINALAIFKDPKAMRSKYGIIITKDQIQAAERTLTTYKTMSDTDLRHVDEKTYSKWPYNLSEEQRYDKLLYKHPLTMAQTILWKNIRAYLSQHPDERKTNATCICKALQDMEGFLQLNAYMGEFEENRKLIDGKDINYIMRLFNLSYRKYILETENN